MEHSSQMSSFYLTRSWHSGGLSLGRQVTTSPKLSTHQPSLSTQTDLSCWLFSSLHWDLGRRCSVLFASARHVTIDSNSGLNTRVNNLSESRFHVWMHLVTHVLPTLWVSHSKHLLSASRHSRAVPPSLSVSSRITN